MAVFRMSLSSFYYLSFFSIKLFLFHSVIVFICSVLLSFHQSSVQHFELHWPKANPQIFKKIITHKSLRTMQWSIHTDREPGWQINMKTHHHSWSCCNHLDCWSANSRTLCCPGRASNLLPAGETGRDFFINVKAFFYVREQIWKA